MNNEDKIEMIKQIYTREEIPTILKLMGLNNSICELGVAKADNFWYMVRHTFPKYALAIDAWSEEVCPYWTQDKHDQHWKRAQEIERRLRKWNKGDINIIKGDHSVLVDNYEDGFFDYVYIDSDHTYESVKKDIEQWWPKVREGGILAGHDYVNRKLYGVIPAVNEFVEANNIEHLYITKEHIKSWIIYKPEKDVISNESV